MSSSIRSIVIVLIGSGVIYLGQGLLLTLLPVRAQSEGFSQSLIGLMGGANFAGFVLGCLAGPTVVKAVGHIRAFAGFAALVSASILLFPLAVDPLAWSLLRGFDGFCLAVVYMVAESWLNDQAHNKVRGTVLSLYVIVANMTTVGGQQMVNLSSIESYSLFSLAAILVGLSLVPLALTPAKEPSPIPSAKLRIRRLFHLSPTGFVAIFMVGLVEGAFWTLGPVFAQQRGLPLAEIAFFMGAFLVGGTITQWPLGYLSDRIDRRWVIAFCAAGTVFTGLTLAFWQPQDQVMAFVVALAHGGFMIPLYPLSLAHTNDYAPNKELVEVSGGLLLLYGVGAAIGPVALGPAMDHFGEAALFIAISAAFGLLAIFALARILHGRIAAADTRGHFAPLTRSSQSVYELEAEEEEEDAQNGSQ